LARFSLLGVISMARLTFHVDTKKLFTPVVLVSLAIQLMPLQPVLAAKQKPLSVPINSQLNQGAGPETSDVASADSGSASGASSATSDSADAVSTAPAAAPDLSPVKLDSPAAQTAAPTTPAQSAATDATSTATPTAAAAEGSSEGSQVLNATVNKDEFVPKAPVDRTDLVIGEPAKKGSKKEELDKQTKELGRKLGPVQLQETENETEKKTATVVDAEKAELADLWDAALCRNQDIQFVVQKLMPAKDPKHTTAVMMKMLSTAMYGAMCASSMAMPSGMSGANMQGMYMAQNAGAGLVMNVLNGAAAKSAKKAAVTETEAIMLYNIIRNVAEKVVENFHEYKKNRASVERGYQDYQDLQNMVSEARSGQDSAKQIEMEYTLRKARRDIDAINDDVRRCRQALVDLSGPESVDKLDKQVAIEMDKVDDQTASDSADVSAAGKTADDGKIPSM
jgi:hypothetical protein